jgi:ATP-dependent protease ClpP protease subunit
LVEPSGGASGQASDIAIHAKEILRVRQLLTSIYQRHCGKKDESEAVGLARFGKVVSTIAKDLTDDVTHCQREHWNEIIL